MQDTYLQIQYSFLIILFAGCSSFSLQSEKGRILYSKNGDFFHVRFCSPSNAHSCQQAQDRPDADVPKADFLDRITASLSLTVEYTLDGDHPDALKIVNKEDAGAIQRKRSESKRIIQQLRQLILFFEKTISQQDKILFLNQLSEIELHLTKDVLINQSITQINTLVESLVPKLFILEKHETSVPEFREIGFLFNILQSFVRKPHINARFIEIKIPKLNRTVEIQDSEVTQEQWFMVMGYNRSSFKQQLICQEQFREIEGTRMCSQFPVENVAWEDALIFAKRLSHSDKIYNYRLPTDIEWLTASTGKPEKAPKDLTKYAWYDGNSGEHSMTVKTLSPNNLGFYDMSGNVWEWSMSEIELNEWQQTSTRQKARLRTIRGGGWFNPEDVQYAQSKDRVLSTHGCPGVGFRLARTKK